MSDLICDAFNYCASSFNVGKWGYMIVYIIAIENLEKTKAENKRKYYMKFHLEDNSGVEFTAC